jgi:membrane protein implicated in regulation of membrane protease activity
MSQKRKKKGRWSVRIIVRYALLQLPAIALILMGLFLVQRWIDIPVWIFWGSIIVWILKDVVLFFFTWRAYDWNGAQSDRLMVGTRGIAQNRLAPSGFIHVRGELWKAEIRRGGRSIEMGEKVTVRDMKGLTLIVKPEEEQEIDEQS